MLKQYFTAKEQHPGVLLAMRVGDFYEFYGEDAEIAAGALEITLTGREDGNNGRISMAGVPFHSVEKYLARLLQQGIKVALCDQLEDPKGAKGLVKRGVTRVLTPGTLMEDSMLASGANNFLAAVCVHDGKVGLAMLDSSTAEFLVTEIAGEGSDERLLQELARVRPAEILLDEMTNAVARAIESSFGTTLTEAKPLNPDRAERKLTDRFEVRNLQGFGCHDKPAAVIAASMILAYAENNGLTLNHLGGLTTYSVDSFMRLDPATRRSLELTQNLADGSKRLTLLSVLDESVSPMGSRLLRKWIEQPLLDTAVIQARLDGVERMVSHALPRGDIRDALKKVADLERLVSRVASSLAGPRDLAALRNTLLALPSLADPLRRIGAGRIQELRDQISDHADLAQLLKKALVMDPPHTVREGGVFAAGHDAELDSLRDLGRNGKSYIAELEQRERKRTGITTLKVGYNAVFGYYLEVSKLHSDKVPEDYIRKQTTANAERYITAELKEHESQVLSAEEKAVALESDLFHRLRIRVAEHTQALLQTGRALAEIDALAALAEVAMRRNFVKPVVCQDDRLTIVAGRHPVVEANFAHFVPNDLDLTESDQGTRTIILTGPNMSGKSTFLRQAALITLMAQMGSYVPAESATVGFCDRIFARIGAKDELALGQSTFMVEMVESANILNHASSRSLVILDEVGRGTSTYDGLAIAWAMVEHLAKIGARTMFATHYHQLNSLAQQLPGVANFRVAVDELGDRIVWTHRVLPGGTDRSYGIHVARMAGVPGEVLSRAESILEELEEKDSAPRAIPATTQRLQLTLFEAEPPPVMQELSRVDPNTLTPMDALRLIDQWRRRFVQNETS